MKLQKPILSLAVLATLSACKPAQPVEEAPPFPALAGRWKPVALNRTCDREHVRFAGNRILLHREGIALPALEINRAAANGSDFDLELSPSRLVASKAKTSQRMDEVLQMEIRLTLAVRGDRTAVRDLQMKDARGVRMPTASERRNAEKIFSLEKCPDGGRTS